MCEKIKFRCNNFKKIGCNLFKLLNNLDRFHHIMKKLFAYSLISCSLFLGNNSGKADWDKYAFENASPILLKENPGSGPDWYSAVTKVYQLDSTSNDRTLINTFQHCADYAEYQSNSWQCSSFSSNSYSEFDTKNGKIKIIAKDTEAKQFIYDVDANNWTIDDASNYVHTFNKALIKETIDGSIQIGGDTHDIDIVSDGLNIDGAAVITKNTDGSVQIGADGNDIDITAEGLNVDGNPLITQKENGEIHIGKNSLITKKEEETLPDGRKVQPLYAEDKDGNRIPINIDGSKLLIDGVEVTAGGDSAQVTKNKNNISTNTSNIKNLGEGVAGSIALTAALSALPQTSKESKLSCGVGTGAYSSRYAVGFGCASKVNERVDINAGGSYVFGGSKSYGGGILDSGVVKAGFIFKLRELNKSNQISMKDQKKMETKIESLEEKNKKIISKNQNLENTVSNLMARLEKLEKIASKDIKSKDLASIKN